MDENRGTIRFFLLLGVLGAIGFTWYWVDSLGEKARFRSECKKFCELENRLEVFERFSTRKQIDYLDRCPCWGDSISLRHLYTPIIAKRQLKAIEVFEERLNNAKDADSVLTNLWLVNGQLRNCDLSGREDFLKVVSGHVKRVPDEDSRDFLDALLGAEKKSKADIAAEYLEEIRKDVESVLTKEEVENCQNRKSY